MGYSPWGQKESDTTERLTLLLSCTVIFYLIIYNYNLIYFLYVNLISGFPGGAVDKNPPANAEDMGSIPGLGRSHMPQSS